MSIKPVLVGHCYKPYPIRDMAVFHNFKYVKNPDISLAGISRKKPHLNRVGDKSVYLPPDNSKLNMQNPKFI